MCSNDRCNRDTAISNSSQVLNNWSESRRYRYRYFDRYVRFCSFLIQSWKLRKGKGWIEKRFTLLENKFAFVYKLLSLFLLCKQTTRHICEAAIANRKRQRNLRLDEITQNPRLIAHRLISICDSNAKLWWNSTQLKLVFGSRVTQDSCQGESTRKDEDNNRKRSICFHNAKRFSIEFHNKEPST